MAIWLCGSTTSVLTLDLQVSNELLLAVRFWNSRANYFTELAENTTFRIIKKYHNFQKRFVMVYDQSRGDLGLSSTIIVAYPKITPT